eukprot:COSAG02_NODE_1981_length_10196_cov_11.415668_10_plen_94_part_01
MHSGYCAGSDWITPPLSNFTVLHPRACPEAARARARAAPAGPQACGLNLCRKNGCALPPAAGAITCWCCSHTTHLLVLTVCAVCAGLVNERRSG